MRFAWRPCARRAVRFARARNGAAQTSSPTDTATCSPTPPARGRGPRPAPRHAEHRRRRPDLRGRGRGPPQRSLARALPEGARGRGARMSATASRHDERVITSGGPMSRPSRRGARRGQGTCVERLRNRVRGAQARKRDDAGARREVATNEDPPAWCDARLVFDPRAALDPCIDPGPTCVVFCTLDLELESIEARLNGRPRDLAGRERQPAAVTAMRVAVRAIVAAPATRSRAARGPPRSPPHTVGRARGRNPHRAPSRGESRPQVPKSRPCGGASHAACRGAGVEMTELSAEVDWRPPSVRRRPP